MTTTRARLESLIRHAERRLAGIADAPNGHGDDGDQAQHAHEQAVSDAERAWLVATIRRASAALERLASGRHGVCEDCGDSIAPSRLRAIPWASRCISCQAKREEA